MLHEICGRPMVDWTIRAALESGAARIVVVDGRDRVLEGHLPEGVTLAVQEEPLGTCDAVRAAAGQIDRAAQKSELDRDQLLALVESVTDTRDRTGAVWPVS